MRALVLMLLLGLFAFCGCGLSSVQKVKLACAESAESIAARYRDARSAEALRKLDSATTERAALCNEAMYRAVDTGAADVPRLVKQIGGL